MLTTRALAAALAYPEPYVMNDRNTMLAFASRHIRVDSKMRLMRLCNWATFSRKRSAKHNNVSPQVQGILL